MGVRIKYGTARGNTVPYPPLDDGIRCNHGFIDTRGRPDLIAKIPEARESTALATLLTRLAQPGSLLASLGCDLGQHDEPGSRLETRRVAGGYVQVIAQSRRDHEFELLQSVAKAFGNGLEKLAGADRWGVNLDLATVIYSAEEAEVEIQSIWIWFFAKSSTSERAVASRERLIRSIEQVIATFEDRSG